MVTSDGSKLVVAVTPDYHHLEKVFRVICGYYVCLLLPGGERDTTCLLYLLYTLVACTATHTVFPQRDHYAHICKGKPEEGRAFERIIVTVVNH